MRNNFDLENAEMRFQALQSEWRDHVTRLPIGWADRMAAMADEHHGLLSAGEWVSGPADLLGIIGRGRRETYHSAILAWLMSASGRHGLGPKFLEAVLDETLGYGEFDPNGLAACTPATEVAKAASQADIVVTGPGLNILFEVKVDAAEGDRQCQRLYNDHCDEGALFVFLTPHGRSPMSCETDESRASWICLSFRRVRAILTDLVPMISNSCDARPAVLSYLTTLNKEFP